MHFILKVSNQGRLEYLKKYPCIDKNYTLHNNVSNEVGCTLMCNKKPILTSCPDKLSVDIFCGHQVFVFKKTSGEILISSNLELIFLSADEKVSVNLNYFVDYISYGVTPKSSTPFVGVSYMPPGSTVTYSNMHVDFGSELMIKGLDFLDLIERGMKERLPSSETITLEYSGGLESSILLHSLLRTTPPESLRLIHLTDLGSGQVDDLQRVKKLAANKNCHLTVLDAEELKPFQIATCKEFKPSFPHCGLVNIGYIDYSSDLLKKNTIILNGSGGDSLFCASPQKGLPIELLKKGNIFGAARNIIDIANYSRAPLIPIIKDSICEFRKMKSKLNNPGLYFSKSSDCEKVLSENYLGCELNLGTPNMPYCNKFSVRERHLNASINRYEMQSSPMANYPDRYFYPFLAPDTLSAGLAIPSHHLLKGKLDRYSIRQRAVARYHSNDFLYTRKGGVSGLTQRYFARYKSEIKDFLTEGFFVRAELIDIDKVDVLIDEVSAGVVKCPGSLINLFTANIYINHWKEYVSEF